MVKPLDIQRSFVRVRRENFWKQHASSLTFIDFLFVIEALPPMGATELCLNRISSADVDLQQLQGLLPLH